MPGIEVVHNVEMGHRLSLQPQSKCYQLHGHSWWVKLRIFGPKDAQSGMIVDFGHIKKIFRHFLDTEYDHHLLLNSEDPLIELAGKHCAPWGIVTLIQRDPTVENFAQVIHSWARDANPFGFVNPRMYRYWVKVNEASTNAAIVSDE